MGDGIEQHNNVAGGHIAAGDVTAIDGDQINVRGNATIYQAPSRPETALTRLYKRLKEEAAEDPELCDYIEQLQVYTRTVSVPEVVGLDEKLIKAGRSDQIEIAKRQKEIIYSELSKNMFSRTFQTIYAILMAKVLENFETHIRPAIITGGERHEIDKLVNTHIIKPLADELDNCPGYDGIAIQTIRGMLYFLTGNCHIVWH